MAISIAEFFRPLAPVATLPAPSHMTDEVMLEIFDQLGVRDLARVQRTCKRFLAICRGRWPVKYTFRRGHPLPPLRSPLFGGNAAVVRAWASPADVVHSLLQAEAVVGRYAASEWIYSLGGAFRHTVKRAMDLLEDEVVTTGFSCEQTAVIRHALPRGTRVQVEALAGSGKTTCLVQVARVQMAHQRSVCYTSFNATIVAEAKARMPHRTCCRTLHSFAMAWCLNEGLQVVHYDYNAKALLAIGYRGIASPEVAGVAVRLFKCHMATLSGELPSAELKDCMSILHTAESERAKQASQEQAMLAAMSNRARANYRPRKKYPLPEPMQLHRDYYTALVQHMLEDMLEGDVLKLTPSAYLRHYALHGNSVGLTRFDVVLVDEQQDFSPLMAHIVLRAPGAIVAVGDTLQQIYLWRNGTGFREEDGWHPTNILRLTKSFRFGEPLAACTNLVLNTLHGPTIRGTRQGFTLHADETMLNVCDAVLGRTNAFIMNAVMDLQRSGQPYRLASLAYVKNTRARLCGEDTSIADTENDPNELATVLPIGADLAERIATLTAVITSSHATGPLFMTVHSSKGREFNSVGLLDDITEEHPNLLYVAMTRARKRLIINSALIDIVKRSPEFDCWCIVPGMGISCRCGQIAARAGLRRYEVRGFSGGICASCLNQWRKHSDL